MRRKPCICTWLGFRAHMPVNPIRIVNRNYDVHVSATPNMAGTLRYSRVERAASNK